MQQHGYTYAATLAASQRINWQVEDIIGGERRLDFDKPFMPDSLARTQAIDCLGDDEKLLLNQIRGNGYLCMFGLVEEFILPFVVDHARPRLAGDDARARAFLQFAGEEAKHIDLFKRFRHEFEAGFGVRDGVTDGGDDVSREARLVREQAPERVEGRTHLDDERIPLGTVARGLGWANRSELARNVGRAHGHAGTSWAFRRMGPGGMAEARC